LGLKTRIYHNPRCSKSRAALALLTARGIDLEVVDYLRNPPSRDTLRALAAKLCAPPLDLVRVNDPELAAFAASSPDVEQVVELLATHPRALQRPIVETADRAVIGRPPELVLDLV
jgi:arsenate reductase